MVAALEWIGARARWVLIFGCLSAVFVPALSAALRPALPFLVAMVYALSMTRLDLGEVARGLARPRRALLVTGASLALLSVAAAAGAAVVRLLGLPPEHLSATVYTFASPPIASAAGFCFLLGLDAGLALQVTVVSSLLMPAVGPAAAHWLLGAAVPISAVELGLRSAAMILGGAAMAIAARRLFGAARIARRARVFDGLVAMAMLLFVIPLFDGVGDSILARPGLAAGYLALSCAIIFAPHALARRLPVPRPQGGALALTGGTRSVAIYLAALPPDPAFTLFVALYQFPMYATPLLLRRFYASG